MNTNNNHLKLLSESITDFKNDHEKMLSTYTEKIFQKISAVDKLLEEATVATFIKCCKL